MNTKHILFLLFLCICTACQTGKLTVLANLPTSLKEVSAVETIPQSNLIWVIEDAGNKNVLYGLNRDGNISKAITITNAKNKDWEDITSDSLGNIYIGDFGNNSKKRKQFNIYKVSNKDLSTNKTVAKTISFSLPKDIKSRDFEAFFLLNKHFYIFSKAHKKTVVFKVPNRQGSHLAELIYTFNFKGKNNKITSADISADGKTVMLLNHHKVWKLSDYKSDYFFSGKVEALLFNHNSQKEGLCFKGNNNILITDERSGNSDANIYGFKLN